MFNLPWYSWFNVLALPIIMVLLWTEYLVAGYKPWTRRLITFQTLACVAIIFLYWNASLFSTIVPVNYLIFVLVGLFYLRTMGGIIFEIVCTLKIKLRNTLTSTPAAVQTPNCTLNKIDFNSDVIVLDDEGAQAQQEMVATNLPTLFDRNATGDDKLKSVFSLLGVPLDDDTVRSSEGYLSSLLLWGLSVGIVLTPPLWMSTMLLR